MKYREMLNFVRGGGFSPVQAMVANEVDLHIECNFEIESSKINESDFERICREVYEQYINTVGIDIWELVYIKLQDYK